MVRYKGHGFLAVQAAETVDGGLEKTYKRPGVVLAADIAVAIIAAATASRFSRPEIQPSKPA